MKIPGGVLPGRFARHDDKHDDDDDDDDDDEDDVGTRIPGNDERPVIEGSLKVAMLLWTKG